MMTEIMSFRRLLAAALPAVAVAVAGCNANSTSATSGTESGSVTLAKDEGIPETELPPLPTEEPPQVEPIPEPSEQTAVAAANSEKAPNTSEKKAAGEKKTTGDWPMWGGSIDRNMVNAATGLDTSFQSGADEDAPEKNLVWTAELGSQTYGNPVVAEGKVYVGTNNGGEHRPQHVGDRGVVLCFDEKDGKFLWQLTREKLPQGRVNDWPEQGICSTVAVENGRVYVVTNRAELMCLDAEGFHDGENDGEYQEETDKETLDADIIWSLDMIEELGVFPHNLATSSPVIAGENVYVITSNGVDEAHLEIPAPRAPSFICVNKGSGELVWESNEPFDKILHGQWSSPSIGEVDGKTQVYFAGGDGWLYAFEAEGDDQGGGKIIWKFDCNPKDAVYELGGRGTRNEIISTPVFYENSVIVAVGQDPEHGEGVGHLYRIDATKQGDVSPQIADGDGWKDNPNSAQIWHYGGQDADGSITGQKGKLIFRRTISTAGIADGLVLYPDLSGYLHCLDLKTGKRYWEHDMFAACWGSPMVADGKIFIGDEDGELTVLPLAKELPKDKKQIDVKDFNSSIYSTPTIANGNLYVSDRSRLYCFKVQ